MAGRIKDEDIQQVREASRIDAVVSEYLQLRSAGGGNLKGLCPFHDERTPSFHVTPARGLYHCFGCQAGGDVIDFVMRLDSLSFTEAVERLAARVGIQLRYDHRYDGKGHGRAAEQSERLRLLAANKAAAEFFRERLDAPDAAPGREFLAERGFDAAAAGHFGVGYAPAEWDALVKHLRGRGFADAEVLKAGLASEGRRGPIDRFRGRLVWPISDITGDVIGFGARRLAEGDNGPKYLNTPETPLYRKSAVLYGLHLAKRDIARSSQVVVVEGYTDVMACHLAGVTTAVATCGTAFGQEHIKILRRLLGDRDDGTFRGRVVFTFDGDAAGQNAALRAFEDDQRFVKQTFVAVEAGGMDPCELRMARGDAAVAALVEASQPLFEFAIQAALRRHDLDTAEGRIAALEDAVPLVAGIRDTALRPEYARRLAGLVGMDGGDGVGRVRQAVEAAARADAARRSRPGGRQAPPPGGGRAPAHQGAAGAAGAPPGGRQREDPASRREHQVQREALKLALQWPKLAGALFDSLDAEEFTAPAFAAVRTVIAAAGGAAHGADLRPDLWIAAVREQAPDDAVRNLVTGLAVEPVRTNGEPDLRYAGAQFARVRERSVRTHLAEAHSRLRRLDAAGDTAGALEVIRELEELERYRVDLDRIFGVT